ncbi:MAG: hypothetical protein IJV64_11165 [Oscillospiraceae bacterium]|nr:hypothetical protein [Oscillospiraceae bacterium]
MRHGVRRNPDGAGTVMLASREYAERYEIIVTDDGPGIDPDKPSADMTRPHIGIQNVRERLAALSGGTLKIESAAGQGTVVTMILPKKAARREET